MELFGGSGPKDDGAPEEATPAPAPGGLQISLVSHLDSLVPPRLQAAITSPFLVIESIFLALTSTGEVVLFPFAAAGLALVVPLRRPMFEFDEDGERQAQDGS